MREQISNVDSAYLRVVGNIVDLYTTGSLTFTCIYLVCLLLTYLMLLNTNVRLLAATVSNKIAHKCNAVTTVSHVTCLLYLAFPGPFLSSFPNQRQTCCLFRAFSKVIHQIIMV